VEEAVEARKRKLRGEGKLIRPMLLLHMQLEPVEGGQVPEELHRRYWVKDIDY
jgi:hypothetical protein